MEVSSHMCNRSSTFWKSTAWKCWSHFRTISKSSVSATTGKKGTLKEKYGVLLAAIRKTTRVPYPNYTPGTYKSQALKKPQQIQLLG